MGEKKHITCQNPSCKTIFTTPLKTLNLQENPTEPYFACPFCLTKTEDEALKIIPELPTEKLKEKFETKEARRKLESKKIFEKNSACEFHLGYLSERSNKEQIPDNCLVCKDIVECMLKKIHE